jgi:hypothetical protein
MGTDSASLVDKFGAPVPDQTKPGPTVPGFRDSQTQLRNQQEPPAKLGGDR